MRNTDIEANSNSKSDIGLAKVVFAAAAGTLIEWYDFFVFGALAKSLSSQFYKTGTADGDMIIWLGAFAAGFITRPIGSLIFGYLGDVVGRKYTFTLTLLLMGGCTFMVGCLPTYAQIGPAAGYLLITLRLIQGLAIGGEYGGAIIFIAEHAPVKHRGFYTGFLQITASLAMLMSIFVIWLCRMAVGTTKFLQWGWRIPFLISVILVLVSMYIRVTLEESPEFEKVKEDGMSKNPLLETFSSPRNLYLVLVALFGANMGSGAVFYVAEFYSLTFLQNNAHVPEMDAYMIAGTALLVGTPFVILFGHLSDIWGRKSLILSGMALSVAFWYPIYYGMYVYGYKIDGDLNFRYSPVLLSLLMIAQIVFAAMAYGPLAAFMSELFPAKIRYTAMSLPLNIGNGIIGGLVPVIGLSVAVATGDMFSALWYPMIIASISVIVGYIFI